MPSSVPLVCVFLLVCRITTVSVAIFLALFEEVTMAKSLLEQVALVAQGRPELYDSMLNSIDRYVEEDLTQITTEPSVLLSQRPDEDPLEAILYRTSVGEPSLVYGTVRALRQARAARLGARQTKLPELQMYLLYTLAAVVLFTFPLLGAGSQTLGGRGILEVQSVYLAFIVFGISLVLGIVNELRFPSGNGAYNVGSVLDIMVAGLREELDGRRAGTYKTSASDGMGMGSFSIPTEIGGLKLTTDNDNEKGKTDGTK